MTLFPPPAPVVKPPKPRALGHTMSKTLAALKDKRQPIATWDLADDLGYNMYRGTEAIRRCLRRLEARGLVRVAGESGGGLLWEVAEAQSGGPEVSE